MTIPVGLLNPECPQLFFVAAIEEPDALLAPWAGGPEFPIVGFLFFFGGF